LNIHPHNVAKSHNDLAVAVWRNSINTGHEFPASAGYSFLCKGGSENNVHRRKDWVVQTRLTISGGTKTRIT